MLSHGDFGNLTPVVQDYLRAHMNELGGMVLPTDWQQTDITKGDAIIKESYANTVKFALRICAGMMAICAVLTLRYRRDDIS